MGGTKRVVMTDYVVSSGPLHTFEHLYDARLDRIKGLRDYPTLTIIAKSLADHRFSEYRRDPVRELAFASTFMASVAPKQTVLCGFHDVHARKGILLEAALKDQSRIRWTTIPYGTAKDDLILMHFKDVKPDFAIVHPHHPPASGGVFFHLTRQVFDVAEIYWNRKAAGSMKEERFHRDVVAFTPESLLTFIIDREGSFAVVSHPSFLDEATLQGHLQEAARRALMRITVAPSLFG